MIPLVDAPGTNASIAASKSSLPRACEKRWTTGVQPPDMATALHASVRASPTPPLAVFGATVMPVT